MDKAFIIVAGDIAYSGLENEYDTAWEFFEYIKDYLEKYSHKEIAVIGVPGNHDCHYDIKNKKVREPLIKEIQKNRDASIDEDVIQQCCEVQSDFNRFTEVFQVPANTLYSGPLLRILKYEWNEFRIIFYCYNTAWMSELNEQPGKIHFPVKLFPKEHLNLEANLHISIMHHPYNWHNPQSVKDLIDHLEKTSQLVITGHGHIPAKSVKDNLQGRVTEYVEGSVMQDVDNADNSGFNVIQMDLGNRMQRILQYEWNGELYNIKEDTGEVPSKQIIRTSKGVFQLSDEFQEKFLNDVGGQFRHPRKANLNLEDVFVFPHIKDIRSEKQQGKYIYYDVRNSNVLLEITDHIKILLIGAEKAGKTSLCKTLFRHYLSKGYVPVYINGEDIKSTSLDKFDKLLSDNYREQFVGNIERFAQLENIKKLLIVDDFDELRINLQHRSELLNRINQSYPNIIITGNSLFQIGEIVAEEGQRVSPLSGYQQYTLLQFGNLLRDELINKWNVLGREETVEYEEIIRRNDETKKVVDTIIGKNLVPSYPIFLLTILQGIEIGYPHNLEESSYGHYYQFLIGEALSKEVDSNDKIDAYNNFLTELAYYLFGMKIREISLELITEFHKWYCKEYTIGHSFTELVNLPTLLQKLTDAHIIENNKGSYKFKYKYVYFFFVAKYFADNITNNEIKEIISEMCKRLHNEDFANTMMFLTHHSKNPFIINEILLNAKRLFPESQPVKFEQDVTAVNSLLKEVPKLVLESRDIRENRENRDILKDKLEMDEENLEQEDASLDIKQEVPELDIAAKLNLTFKMLEILGQILKNYHSSLKGPLKLSIGEEAYLLGLRSLQPFFGILETHNQIIVNNIRTIIEKKKLINELRIEEVARKFLFSLSVMVSTGFVTQIADSVGSEHLSKTFKEILKRHDITSVHLVDVSIKLDFYHVFPLDEVKELKKKLENNLLALTILKEMVIDYLYMFPTSVKVKQRICAILEIPMQEQRLIDATSSQKKK